MSFMNGVQLKYPWLTNFICPNLHYITILVWLVPCKPGLAVSINQLFHKNTSFWLSLSKISSESMFSVTCPYAKEKCQFKKKNRQALTFNIPVFLSSFVLRLAINLKIILQSIEILNIYSILWIIHQIPTESTHSLTIYVHGCYNDLFENFVCLNFTALLHGFCILKKTLNVESTFNWTT